MRSTIMFILPGNFLCSICWITYICFRIPCCTELIHYITCCNTISIIRTNIIESSLCLILILSLSNCKIYVQWFKNMLIWSCRIWISDYYYFILLSSSYTVRNNPVWSIVASTYNISCTSSRNSHIHVIIERIDITVSYQFRARL